MKTIALPLTLLLAGCFSPNFRDGSFACGADGLCPDKQSCSPLDGLCYTHLPVAAGPDARAPDASPDALPDAGAAEVAEEKRTMLWGVCTVTKPLDPLRTDSCVQGAVCIQGDMVARCLPKCSMTGPNTCEGDFGPCELRRLDKRDPLVTAEVCGPTKINCNPVAGDNAGCPEKLTCYVRGADTYCDLSSSDGGNMSPCPGGNKDCLPQFACGTDVRCHVECAARSTCPGTGGACVLASLAAMFGTCPL